MVRPSLNLFLLPLCCTAVFHREVLIESSACRKSGRMLCLAVWGFSAAVCLMVSLMLKAHSTESDNNSPSFKTKWIKTDLGRLKEREVRIERENEKYWTARSPTDCMNVLETNRCNRGIEKMEEENNGMELKSRRLLGEKKKRKKNKEEEIPETKYVSLELECSKN